MAVIKPRRGIKSLWDTYKNRVYKEGEMLVESPESGVGTGAVNVKFGDGVTNYANLPYAIQAPISECVNGSDKPLTSGAGYNLKKQIDNTTANLAVERSRIDNLAKLEEGSTTGDAELIDIRTGANGITYETAGEAVRGQVSQLSSVMGEKQEKNMFFTELEAVATVASSYFSSLGNKIVESTSDKYRYKEYAVSPNTRYLLQGIVFSTNMCAIAYFNGDNLVAWEGEPNNEDTATPYSKIITTPKECNRVILNNFSAHNSDVHLYGVNYYDGNLRESFKKIDIEYNYGYVTTIGKKYVTGNPVENANYKYAVIDVKPLEVYHIICASIYSVAGFCVINDSLVDNVLMLPSGVPTELNTSLENIHSSEDIITIPLGATKMILQYLVTQGATLNNGNDFILVEKLEYTNYIGTNKHGLKWLAIGDSLTSKSTLGESLNYTDYVSNALGINCTNVGVGGAGFINPSSNNNEFYNQIPDNGDFDIITAFGSFNDIAYKDTLGTIDDTDTTTIAGCVYTFIQKCIEKYPGAKIVIVSPTPWQNVNGATSNIEFFQQYASLLEDMCKKFSIDYLDLSHYSNMKMYNDNFVSKYTKDGTHPNSLGHLKFIAPKFVNKIKSLL